MTVDILFKISAAKPRIILDDHLCLSYTVLQQPSSKFLQKMLRRGTGRKDLLWSSEHQNPDSSFPVLLTQASTEPGARQAQSRAELKENCKITLLCPALLLALTKCRVQNMILSKTHQFNRNHCWYIVTDRYRPLDGTVAWALGW